MLPPRHFAVKKLVGACILIICLLPLANANTKAIEEQITQLEIEHNALPSIRINPTPWTLGYRAQLKDDINKTIEVELQFKTAATIDMIALMPSIHTTAEDEVIPFGFPERFTIERILSDGTSEMLIDYSERDYKVTGVEPQIFPLEQPEFAAGIRIKILREAKNTSWWKFEHATALSEVFVFSGKWNVALGAKVRTTSHSTFGYVWNKNCLVDGFSLLLPVTGELQNPMENFHHDAQSLTLLFDLGESQPVDELRLWPVVHSAQHNFPLANGIGFPTKIRLECTKTLSTSYSEIIDLSVSKLHKPGSGPLMLRFPRTTARYFKLILEDPVPEYRIDRALRFDLSEIELLNKGELLSHRIVPQIIDLDHSQSMPKWLLARLTNSQTGQGRIMPLRNWLEGLAQQASITRELQSLRSELEFTQRQERDRLKFYVALSLCVITILIILIYTVKLTSDKNWRKVRDQIASDLHDEIGANVSSLVHMTELIQEEAKDPNEVQQQMLEQALKTARITAQETRNFVRFLELTPTHFDVTEQIRKTAAQILGNVSYHCDLSTNKTLRLLKPNSQWNLLMFIKEALNNIIKHAEADHVEIEVRSNGRTVFVRIEDNGRGIPKERLPLRHLEARAEKLGSTLKLKTQEGKGTQVSLNLNK